MKPLGLFAVCLSILVLPLSAAAVQKFNPYTQRWETTTESSELQFVDLRVKVTRDLHLNLTHPI